MMKRRISPTVILFVLFTYILLQFLWWEILLVRQSSELIDGRMKIAALNIAGADELAREIATLQKKKRTRIFMIAGEGTVFLLILLYGVARIKRAYDKEERLTRQQRNFFLSITHELKTPIAATKLQLQTLQKPGIDAGAKSNLVHRALEETERLNNLIDRVLLAGKMDAGELRLQFTQTDINLLAGEVLQRYFSQHVQSGRLVLRSSQPVPASVDREAATSIITNVVENALKYSDRSVIVEIREDGKFAILKVSDEGPGIPVSDRHRIFERFYRSGNELVRRSKGTGLGLFIVKHLVNAHGGTVDVRPNLPNGSVFEIRLPA